MKYPFPTLEMLRRKVSCFHLTEGWLELTFKFFESKKRLWNFIKFIAGLCFDEMGLSSVGQIDFKIEQIVGPNTEAQMFMCRSLCDEWKLPLFVGFDMSPEKLYQIFIEAIVRLTQVEVDVLITTCDQVQCLKIAKNVSLQLHSDFNKVSPR